MLKSPVRKKQKQGYGIFLGFDKCRRNAIRTNQIPVVPFLPALSLPVDECILSVGRDW